MNNLYLVVTSDLKQKSDIKRFIESVDYYDHIHVIFVNQSENKESLSDFVIIEKCDFFEIFTGKKIPLATARNIALEKIYNDFEIDSNSLVMFSDDDAWFPHDTIEYLLNMSIRAISLKTIDPYLNKSFSSVKKIKGEIKGSHLVKDIVSICMVVPLWSLFDSQIKFNEKLGLGNYISQGEESLFVFKLHEFGLKFYYDNHIIYHPYKKNFNMRNFYSLSYFWGLGLFYVSKVFLRPAFMYLIKYTIALGFAFKDVRYLEIFKNVWLGFLDGKKDKYGIFKNE